MAYVHPVLTEDSGIIMPKDGSTCSAIKSGRSITVLVMEHGGEAASMTLSKGEAYWLSKILKDLADSF